MSALPRYVVLGEALTDMIRHDDGRWSDHPGGACWNVARVGARLGIPTAFAGAVSQDYFGDALLRESEAAGLDLRFIQQLPHSPLLAMVSSRQPPRYQFVGDDSADLHFDPSLLPRDWMLTADILGFGGISLARAPLADRLLSIAAHAAAAGKRIAFDPNIRATMDTEAYRARFERMLQLTHYLKVSDEDLAALYPRCTLDEAVAEVRKRCPHARVLLTRGAEGMRLLHGATYHTRSAFRIALADTVGCGDAAMGSWMGTLLANPAADAATQLDRAAAAAAVTASRTGAYAPLESELQAMLAGAAS